MKSLIILIALFTLIISACSSNSPLTNEKEVITIYWADWSGSVALKELVKEYEEETGITVQVITVGWAEFQDTIYEKLTNKNNDIDMVVGDSQWLGWGSGNGHYIELTSWMEEKNVRDKIVDNAVTALSEYPKGSQRYWSIPAAADAVGFAYREDLFNDLEEKAAFEEKYGYELAPPQTISQLRDVAQFFTRPQDDLYGISTMSCDGYDGITMAVDSFIWSYGGSLGDYNTYQVKGHLDTDNSIEALKIYKELYSYNPPSWEACLSDGNKVFIQGRVAMVQDFFGFYPQLLTDENPYAETTGFFIIPKGPSGDQYTSIGGQGISVVAYSKNKDLSFDFLEWFIQDEVQKKYAQLGAQTVHKTTIDSTEFLNQTKFHRAYAQSLIITKDFWADKEYNQLLELSQQRWRQYIQSDNITAQETMTSLANDWEDIFEYSGYYRE